MPLYNHTLPNIVSGVSQQFSEARFETQVEDMVNCIPSLARGILRRNPLKNKKILQQFNENYFTYTYDRGTGNEQYIICIGSSSDWYVYNLNTGELKGSGTDPYLAIIGTSTPKDSFRCITIGDYTFVVNKTKQVQMAPITTEQLANEKLWINKTIYWIKKTTSVLIEQRSSSYTRAIAFDDSTTGTTGSLQEGYEYILTENTTPYKTQGIQDTRTGVTAVDRLTSSEIASHLASKITGMNATESYVYNTNTYKTYSYSDSFGDEASLLVWKDVRKASELPSTLPSVIGDKIVRISGVLDGNLDDYYMRYNSADKTWSETVKPNIKTKLDASTMPHCFIRQANLSFTFEEYTWKDRIAGDEDTLESPSFIDKYINNIFFHKNRLGFITNDSIILSELGEYGNFFGTTVQNIPDDDPIDLLVATTDVTVLRHCLSTTGTLVLFSDDAQFILDSGNRPLTPQTADIKTVSNYTYSASADAKAIGNKIYFMSESGGYSQVFAYNLSDGIQPTEAIQLTGHIPSYIPLNVKQIVGHSVLGFVFMLSTTDKKSVYVLNSVTRGNQDVQNAFNRWEFDRDILGIHIINNKLYILFEDGTLADISLEIPGTISSVSYLDFGDTPYTSYFTLSEFYIKDAEGNGTSRGRTQLRTIQLTVTDESKYKTIISNKKVKEQIEYTSWLVSTGFWNDLLEWEDDAEWKDSLPLYDREYYNDIKSTIAANTKDTSITISSDDTDNDKGFEIATVNIEVFFNQRSKRY